MEYTLAARIFRLKNLCCPLAAIAAAAERAVALSAKLLLLPDP